MNSNLDKEPPVYSSVYGAVSESAGPGRPGLLDLAARHNVSPAWVEKTLVIVPTLNAASTWSEFSAALLRNISADRVLIIDSNSADDTAELARQSGFRIQPISRAEFNHGTTRQQAVDQAADVEYLVFLTQDATLSQSDSLLQLLSVFNDDSVGAAYGRQLPRPQAGPIEAHARLFNYPPQSAVRSMNQPAEVNFKSIFISNSFAAYRRTALQQIGGFPSDVIMGEDTIAAARMLLAGWKIAYAAEATAIHSHGYTLGQEFQRYFDTGVMHARAPWLLREFGNTAGEGFRFLRSEIRYVSRVNPLLLPVVLLRTAAKLVGYRLGRNEGKLPRSWKRPLSMHKGFWLFGS